MNTRLLTLYISGMDFRRINKIHTPFLYSFLKDYPWARIRSFPVYDLLPITLTGVYPPEQGNEVRLKAITDNFSDDNFLDLIPDFLTTTYQCFLHYISGSFDLAAIPPRRRRRLNFNRSKYINRNVKNLLEYNGLKTIFDVIGPDNSEYIFIKKKSGLRKISDSLNSAQSILKFYHIYTLDNIQHWNLDYVEKVYEIYREVDELIKNIYKMCNSIGIKLLVISENGQEIVKGSINIINELGDIKLNKNDFTYFIEPVKARFWFHTEIAQQRIIQKLNSLKNGIILTYNDFKQYNLNYNRDHGEVFFIAKPGYIFFPHDFYNPLANIFLGLANSQERSRIWNPRHRGHHHYLPTNESDKGFVLLLDDDYHTTGDDYSIVDLAPTILSLTGFNTTESMKGDNIFIQ